MAVFVSFRLRNCEYVASQTLVPAARSSLFASIEDDARLHVSVYATQERQQNNTQHTCLRFNPTFIRADREGGER